SGRRSRGREEREQRQARVRARRDVARDACRPPRLTHTDPRMGQTLASVDARWMELALAEARQASAAGDVPVGAVIVCDDTLVARSANRTVRDGDPTAHSELLAIRAAAAARGDWRLSGC